MEQGLKVWIKPVLLILAALLAVIVVFAGFLFAIYAVRVPEKAQAEPQGRWEQAAQGAESLDGARVQVVTGEHGEKSIQILEDDGTAYTFTDFTRCKISLVVRKEDKRAEFELDCRDLGAQDAEVEISLRIREVQPDGSEMTFCTGSNQYLASNLDEPIVPDNPLAPVDFSGKALDNHLDIQEYLGIDRAAALLAQAQRYMEMIEGAV